MAVSWYRKAAEQGYADAECCYGVCLEQGNGVEKDVKEAVSWYQKAALHGHATGMNNLGVCYERGDGVEKDEKAALMWYERAADRGSSYGCRNAARFYQDGKVVSPDVKKRRQNIWKDAQGWGTVMPWFVSAGFMSLVKEWRRILKRHWTFIRLQQEKGNPLGMRVMGVAFRDGLGVRKNVAKARYWFEKAAEKGDVFSDITVAFCCLTGIAGKPDPKLGGLHSGKTGHAANM